MHGSIRGCSFWCSLTLQSHECTQSFCTVIYAKHQLLGDRSSYCNAAHAVYCQKFRGHFHQITTFLIYFKLFLWAFRSSQAIGCGRGIIQSREYGNELLLKENAVFTYVSCILLCYVRHILRIKSALVQSFLLQVGILLRLLCHKY